MSLTESRAGNLGVDLQQDKELRKDTIKHSRLFFIHKNMMSLEYNMIGNWITWTHGLVMGSGKTAKDLGYSFEKTDGMIVKMMNLVSYICICYKYTHIYMLETGYIFGMKYIYL